MSATVDDALLQTVAARHGRIAFFTNDISAVGKSLALYGEWAENEIAFMRHFIPEGATVLDVGAYLGTHSLAFARFAGPAGRVLAFEAQPLAFAILQRNVSANRLSCVEPMNAVVADHAGTVSVPSIAIERQGSYGSASLRAQLLPDETGLTLGTGQEAAPDVEVAAVTIDSLGLAACALIKIDAEGTEDVVLRGARATIGRLRPVIYAECNAIADGLRSIGVLRALGYEVRLHLVDAFNGENFRGATRNIFADAREAALLAVPAADSVRLDAIPLRGCEMLVRIETADDLALALLNKPQYPSEILANGAAARSGAGAWLDDIASRQMAFERLRNEHGWAMRTLAEERTQAADQLSRARDLADASMRQAQAARAEAERLRDHNQALRASADAAHAQMLAMYASTSWRLTRPVRLLRRILRRLR